ncbi:MAG: hypothetical protein HOK52_09000 [Candidatus Marinimicrobia bacterium]|jgi:hypothetical protein|nr:hypothetical protein [Candidatus Neomarinimicrobiota bacterium]MBT3936261.1 hypothetical protein [Candidatus Neomarinimicrobiota bacterium]MBT3960581.1 hypothetical protein [Candidatus Neomarinimicrobiota bacterium]MBT4383257.1 hypothetical protein [Candidatus Neomarinimicrobiota bacterium]MBT4636205.1 hypothetical protein [Candidatus Neomarinimicrobiota bacterium]
MKKYAISLFIIILATADVSAIDTQEDAGKLFIELGQLDGKTFKSEGILKKSWLQIDEDNPNYVMQIGDRKYSITLDDGRGTSQLAKNCSKENMFKIDSNLGCPVSFEAEYDIELNSGSVTVKLIVWGVKFK